MAFVDLKGVSLTYRMGKETTLALADATFSIDKGEFIAVVGPSGCGKSTIMKLVTGLLPASGGEVRVAGEKVSGPIKGVGMAFQNPTLMPWRTTMANILLPMEVVEPHARCRDSEHVRGAAVPVSVEFDLEVFRLVAIVAATHRRLDRASVVAAHPRADPEGGLVIDEAHLHPVSRRAAFIRLGLDEIGDRLCPGPELLIEVAVQLYGTCVDAHGARLFERSGRPGLGCGLLTGRCERRKTEKAENGQKRSSSVHVSGKKWKKRTRDANTNDPKETEAR